MGRRARGVAAARKRNGARANELLQRDAAAKLVSCWLGRRARALASTEQQQHAVCCLQVLLPAKAGKRARVDDRALADRAAQSRRLCAREGCRRLVAAASRVARRVRDAAKRAAAGNRRGAAAAHHNLAARRRHVEGGVGTRRSF